MSFDLARKHLKTDLTKRAIIDESIAESTKKAQPQAKVRLIKDQKQQRPKKPFSSDTKAAAKPIAKRYNPYVNAVDERRGSVKAIEKQLKIANTSLNQNASGVFFDEEENHFNKVDVRKKKRSKLAAQVQDVPLSRTQRKRAKKGVDVTEERQLSTKALLNLQYLTRTNNEDADTKKKKHGAEAKYAQRIKKEVAQKRRWGGWERKWGDKVMVGQAHDHRFPRNLSTLSLPFIWLGLSYSARRDSFFHVGMWWMTAIGRS